MKRAWPIVLIVFGVSIFMGQRRACNKGFDAGDLKYEKFQTEYFSIDVPKGWEEKTRRIQGTFGHLKLERKTKENIDITWLGDGSTPEETFDMARAALEGAGATMTNETSGTGIDFKFHRFGATLKRDGKTGYLAISSIACSKTSVMVTVAVAAMRKGSANGVIDHVMETFECRGDAPVEQFTAQPSTSLDDSWGFALSDGTPIVVRKDGAATVVVTGNPGDSAQTMVKEPKLAEDIFSKAMGMTLKFTEDYRQISGTRGSSVGGMTATLDGDAIGFGVIYCKDISTSFILIAEDTAGDPMALIPKFSCPGSFPRSIDKLPSACKIGLTDYCSDAEKQTEPSEKPVELSPQ